MKIGVGLALHVGDAAQVRLELLELGRASRCAPSAAAARAGPRRLSRRRSCRRSIRLGDRAPVGQQAAEPAVVHVRHADALRLLLDGVLRLLLRADEEHGAAPLGDVAHELVRLLEQLERLLQVDDVDAAALGEDVAAHLRVPAPGLVAEVDAGLQQLPHGDHCHGCSPFWLFAGSSGGPDGTGLEQAGTATRPTRRVVGTRTGAF